jgi:hypothetical protein
MVAFDVNKHIRVLVQGIQQEPYTTIAHMQCPVYMCRDVDNPESRFAQKHFLVLPCTAAPPVPSNLLSLKFWFVFGTLDN